LAALWTPTKSDFIAQGVNGAAELNNSCKSKKNKHSVIHLHLREVTELIQKMSSNSADRHFT
jgi:hypothetical protein